MELLRVQEEEDLVEAEESQQVQQVELLVRPRVLEDEVEGEAGDGDHVHQEVALQVSLCNELEITDDSLLFNVLVLHEEVPDDVQSETDFHDGIYDYSSCCIRPAKAGEKRRKKG